MNPFQKFQLYDFLANIVPGYLILLAVFLLLRPEVTGFSGVILLAVSLVVSYTLGQVIQGISSTIEKPFRIDHFGNILERVRKGEGDEVEENFWEICQDKFDLSSDYDNTGRILRLCLGYLESKGSKARKLQRIYTFHRSMWTLFVLFSVGSLTALVYELVFGGLVSMEVLVSVLITSLALTWIFFQRMRKFSYIYIEYVISDFIVES
jgi:hypothetical protein